MSSNKFNKYSKLQTGVGLRVPHYRHILEKKPKVDFFEIISENFMVDGGRPIEVLDEILETYPVIQHGVSLYFGSPEMPTKEHLNKLKRLTEKTKTPWISDHLCWGSVDGTYTHDLLPLPYTKEVASIAADKIKQVSDFLGLPVAVENLSSYAEFEASEMTEWDFLNLVVEKADCGILLDVNNIHVSSYNHKFDVKEYVDSVDIDRVAQIHIAGHSKQDAIIIDTHDRAPIDEVWELYEYTISKLGSTPTLVEWDASIPSFEEVQGEANKAKSYIDASL